MSLSEKLQSVFILISILLGLRLGQITWIAENAVFLIVPALIIMLYGVFLNIPLNHLGKAIQNYKVAGLSLAVNFLWTPIFAWGLGAIFLKDSPDIWVGLIMLMVTPCTDWYLIFTGIAKGNTALATALLPWNLILQILLLPIYLLVFAKTLVDIDTAILLKSVTLVLAVPLLLALASKYLISKLNSWWYELPLKIAAGQTFFLCVAITAMFASEGQLMMQRPELLGKILIPLVIFFGVNFCLGLGIRKLNNFTYEELACFNCTTLARNSPISLVIATSAFPDRPLIPLTIVIGPLIELPLMVLVSQLLLFIRLRERYS